MSAGSEILDRLYPLLVSNLNVPNLIPYLRQEKLLTNDEEERLHVGHDNTMQNAAKRLVMTLKTKGSDLTPVRLFLSALKQSTINDTHLGHEEIIAKLEELLKGTTELVVFMSLSCAVPPPPPPLLTILAIGVGFNKWCTFQPVPQGLGTISVQSYMKKKKKL